MLPLPSKGGACTGGRKSRPIGEILCGCAERRCWPHWDPHTHCCGGSAYALPAAVSGTQEESRGEARRDACLIGIKAQTRCERGDQDRTACVARGVSFASPDIRQAVLVSSFITYPRERRFSHAGGGESGSGSLSPLRLLTLSTRREGGSRVFSFARTLRGGGVLCVSLVGSPEERCIRRRCALSAAGGCYSWKAPALPPPRPSS